MDSWINLLVLDEELVKGFCEVDPLLPHDRLLLSGLAVDSLAPQVQGRKNDLADEFRTHSLTTLESPAALSAPVTAPIAHRIDATLQL